MFDLSRGALALLALAATIRPADAADVPPARPIVAGFERFHAGDDSDPAIGGRLLIGELNCVACHAGPEFALAPVARKQAPILDRVGTRVQVDHLKAFLGDPHRVKPGTTMPNLLAGLPKEQAEETVEALVHFLATTGSPKATAPSRKLIPAGETLYKQSGCAACHGPAAADSTAQSFMVPLGDPGSKYTYGSLTEFLLDPLAHRPSGRMPAVGLKATEAQAVAAYLMRGVKLGPLPDIAFEYYEGWWSEIPDLDKLKPDATGTAEGLDLGAAKRKNGYALRFRGTLEIDQPGRYGFFTSSDDGSRLLVDGKPVVDNDGIHPTSEASGRIRLEKGKHQIVVTYFDGGGQAELDVEYEGPGVIRRPLETDLSSGDGSKPVPAASAARFAVDPDRAAKGRALFSSIGCASCHQLREGGQPIAARPSASPLATLRGDAGCLAADTPSGVPDYDLSTRQRVALASALKPDPTPPTTKQSIDRTMLAFNCYTCHQRDGMGGVEEGWSDAFATTQKEMGEEGRIPPNLSGVGGKLTETWLKHILADGAKDRPYMLARMPKFGEKNVGHLLEPLAALDAVPAVPVPDLDVPLKRAKATGRYIVGAQAFNCGSCHQFKEYQASGIQALDMTKMSQRLRRDWFHRYVVDPQLYRPGTRMPAAWPGGKSQLEAIYGGDTAKQIESIWLYLADGPEAAVPFGLGRDPIPLVADRDAVIYRNFIQGAGPRGIGVGYPEKANLAFDAANLRLAMIWQGAFIDASKHWSGRGEGYQTPLGDNILNLADGPTFANLPNDLAEWPKGAAAGLGQRFRGYRLGGGGRPVFLYDVGGVHVEDFPEAVTGKDVASIRRTIDLASEGPSPGLTLRAAVGKKIEPVGGGWYSIDGEWKLRVSSAGLPFLRTSAGKAELLVPVPLQGGKGRVVEEFAW